MPFTNMSVQGISIDCLNSTRLLAMTDTFELTESTSPQIRDLMMRMNQQHLRMADEWNQLLSRKGWHMASPARPELISQTSSHLSSMGIPMTMMAYSQAGMPGYQYTTQPSAFPTVISPQSQ